MVRAGIYDCTGGLQPARTIIIFAPIHIYSYASASRVEIFNALRAGIRLASHPKSPVEAVDKYLRTEIYFCY